MCRETEVLTAGFNRALLPVRLHFAVNSDRSWNVILISLDIYTETHFPFSPPLFPPFISLLCLSGCLWLWPSASVAYDLWWVAQQRNKPSVFIQSTPQDWQCLFSLLRERQKNCTLLSFWSSGRRAVARGPFHNFSLVHGAVGWCAVSAWWLLLSKKMSQFITLSKHFHGPVYHKKSELRIGGLGGLVVLEMWAVFSEE